MIIKSLTLVQKKLVPVEVEVSLLPGIPQIHFLGLADRGLKESSVRIKAAIRAQGYRWPKAHQIIVNIRPHEFPKNSVGIELAVAVGILIQTKQIDESAVDSKPFCYGELSLEGKVTEPTDLRSCFISSPKVNVLTGEAQGQAHFCRQMITELKDLNENIVCVDAVDFLSEIKRPELKDKILVSDLELQLLKVLALTELNVLFAGPSGAGKSTFAKLIPKLLSPPKEADFVAGRVMAGWRPVMMPHHSISPISMVGGGVPPRPGDIGRAHGGVLVLDEMMEFDPSVLEALREPVEEGTISISRGMSSVKFDANFMLIATTNLCPCGDWLPGKEESCSYSRQRCHSTRNKISIPFLDRFGIFYPAKSQKNRKILHLESFISELDEVRSFQESRACELQVPALWEMKIDNLGISSRRSRSLLRVVRGLADVDLVAVPNEKHWVRAWELAVEPFLQMKS